MANIVGGYAVYDATAIYAAGESGLLIPTWNDDLKRIINKPVWVTVDGDKPIKTWCGVIETDAGAYGLVGTCFVDGVLAPVFIYTESAEEPVVVFKLITE